MLFVLIVIYIVFISLGLPDSLFGVSWPVVHNEFAINESFASVYSIIISVATGGVSFVSGVLIRKFGTAKVTYFSTLLTVIGLIGISFSPNIVLMMIFSIVMGYGAGAIDTGLNNFVSLNYKAHHMNFLHCFWGVGVTVSPLIMSLFLGDGGTKWRDGYRVIALMQFAISLLVLLSIKKWNRLEAQKNDSSDSEENAEKKGFTEIIRIKGVLTGILSLGFYCSMEFLIGTWGASYAVNTFSLPPDEAAKWVSIYYGGIMLGRIIAGFLSMKKSDRFLITLGIGVSLVGIFVFALPLGESSLLGFILIGIGFGPIFPSILHCIPERFGKTYSADITGFHMGGAYAIGFTLQMLYGFAATGISFKITPYVLVSLSICLFAMNNLTNKLTAKK